MDEMSNNTMIQILNAINNLQTEMIKSINFLKEDINAFRKENNKRWDENEKRWEENNRRWNENEKRWKENQKRWEENNKLWAENIEKWKQYEANRKKDKEDIIDVFMQYEQSVSILLGDPNAKKVAKLV